MINLAFNLLVFGMSQTAMVTCCIVFAVIAVISGGADSVLIVQEHKRRAKKAEEAPAEAVEEESKEPAPAEEAQEEAQEDAQQEEALSDAESDDEAGSAEVASVVVNLPDGPMRVRVRYNRSFTAKIIQSTDVAKNYYSEIKNELMRYGVKNRFSWRYESFRKGRKLLAKMTIRGKTLYLYLALDPANYAQTKYKIHDVSAVSVNSAVPTLYKIRNDRRLRYSKQLIAELMQANGLSAGAEQNVDYVAQYPYEDLEALVDKGLIKVLSMEEEKVAV